VLIKLVTRVGEKPLVLPISQFVVCQDNGTPIAVGAEYGPANTQAISMVGMPDFQRILRMLGINTTVLVDTLQLPKHNPEAKLIAGPTE